MKKFPFMLVYATAPALVVGLAVGGWTIALTPLLVFLVIPLLDTVMGHNVRNPTAEDEAGRASDWLYMVPLWLWVPVQLGLVAWGTLDGPTRGPGELVALAVATGLLTGGIGITIAHELMHRTAPRHKALAEVLMLSVLYPHFSIEHVFGHHRHVGTPADPATSRLGEGLYAYLPRTLLGGLASAVRIEVARTKRAGIAWYSPRHRLTRYALSTATLVGLVLGLLGPLSLAFFVIQATVAVLLLETINYVEHYGLARKQLPTGRYERVRPHHSWNANHRLTGYWLFNLQRHADHHAHASRPYHLLRAVEQGPQLPHGYPTMLMLAFVPPLWRRVMDPRVAALAKDAPLDEGNADLAQAPSQST